MLLHHGTDRVMEGRELSLKRDQVRHARQEGRGHRGRVKGQGFKVTSGGVQGYDTEIRNSRL